MIILFLLIFGVSSISFGVGLYLGSKVKVDFLQFYERETYHRGFENGIYYTINSYEPNLFKVQIADKSYKEYKKKFTSKI